MENRAYTLVISNKVAKQLDKLDRPVRFMLMEWINAELASLENPRSKGKELDGTLSGSWVYRKGYYRIICDIQDEKAVILALEIGHRSDIYKKAQRK